MRTRVPRHRRHCPDASRSSRRNGTPRWSSSSSGRRLADLGSSRSGSKQPRPRRRARRHGRPAWQTWTDGSACRSTARAGCRVPIDGDHPRAVEHGPGAEQSVAARLRLARAGPARPRRLRGLPAGDVPAHVRGRSPCFGGDEPAPSRSAASPSRGTTTTMHPTSGTSRPSSTPAAIRYVVSIHVASPVSTKANREARPAPHHPVELRLNRPSTRSRPGRDRGGRIEPCGSTGTTTRSPTTPGRACSTSRPRR